jgi:hypothetical protein
MMTETIAPADSQATRSPRLARPETDGAALRAIEDATAHIRERALQIRQNPEEHKPRLVLSQHVRGTSLLELSIMISLQVSANRAQAASDRRAIADHETLIALHEMAKQQLDILNGQDRVLAILDNFASKDMPGRQRHIQDCVDQILAKVDPRPAAS